MVTADQELLLEKFAQLLEVPARQGAESPVENNKNGAQDQTPTAESAAPKQFTFRRGDYQTGQPPIPVLPVAPKDPEPPSIIQSDGKKAVETPEQSYMVSPDKLRN